MSTRRFQIEDRWSEKIAEHGWSAVPSIFLKSCASLEIKPTEAMVIVQIMSYKWDERKPFPSVSKLAKRLGLSAGQVRAHLRSLERRGILNRVERIGRSNEYDMQPLIDRLEKILDQGPELQIEYQAAEAGDPVSEMEEPRVPF